MLPGLAVVRILSIEVASYLDPATYHNYYWQFKDIIPQIGQSSKNTNSSDNTNTDNGSPKIKECIKFMKYNPNVNYAQGIVSIYCTDRTNGIKDWNKTENHCNYYNNILTSHQKWQSN